MTTTRRSTTSIATLLLALLTALQSGAEANSHTEPPLLPEPTIQALAEELSGTAARNTVQELSLHHRTRGSRGFRAAAEAIRERAIASGLSEVEILELPADGEIFYGTQRSRPAWNVDHAELWEQREVDGVWEDHRRIADWRTRPVTVAQDSASGEANAELVDIGAGSAPSDYEGRDVTGKLVLTSSQPGAVERLALERGAVGIVSYAQNQRSAWWGEDHSLVRWGHLQTFPAPRTFGFMVTVNQALSWQARLARGETVRLRASVKTTREAGSYDIVTAVIPGADPDLRQQEVAYSCHLDHQRPGANDNSSGCAAILEVARALQAAIDAGRLAPPKRTLRFIWPPEIEGTIALLNARPDLVARTRAVIHMDMVGGHEDRTRSMLHVTRSPRSLPTAVNDVAEAFARFVNRESYEYSATGTASYPLVDPEGSRQALRAQIAGFSTGSDHQVWTEGSFRVPAIYLNDWPDRYIHTHQDGVWNIDPTKLLRAAFIGAASGYYLATLGEEEVPELLDVVRGHALERTADALRRARELPRPEAENLLRQHAQYETNTLMSVGALAPWPVDSRDLMRGRAEEITTLIGEVSSAPAPSSEGEFCLRKPSPKGPLSGFGYSWLADHLSRNDLATPDLLSYRGRWGGGSEIAYEVLNLVNGQRSTRAIRDAVSATYGPVPLDLVGNFLQALEAIGLVDCGAQVGFDEMMVAETAPLATRTPRFPPPEETADLALGGYTKVLCTAVFVNGRAVEEAARNSAYLFLPENGQPSLDDIEVDRERGEVRVRRNGRVSRVARLHGDHGCVSLPQGGTEIHYEPVTIETALPDAATTVWPLGDRDATLDPGDIGIDATALESAVDLAFADPEALTQAVVVVHKGKILAERYAGETGMHTQLESWSMGKSLTATLIGVLVEQGALELDQPAPIAAWGEPGDPRGDIRLLDLLRMSSGLEFLSHHDRDWTPDLGYLEHWYIYTGGIDVFDFSTSRPLQFPPGTEGRYRNSDPLTLAGIVAQTARGRGEEPLTFPQRALFDRIGIREQLLETDPFGNWILSGYDYGTARNWARIGMLYLNDGLFEGERVLPEGWSELISSPAPGWKVPRYGGMFWLNRTGQFSLPADAYYAAGAGGQYTIVVPSLDLVVVRMGHLRGGGPGHAALDGMLAELSNLFAKSVSD